MKKVNKKFFLLPVLLLSLAACSSGNLNKALQNENKESNQFDLDVNQEVESYKIVLPTNISGIQFSVNNDKPHAFEKITLSVRVNSYLTKRVDKITMNGTVLNGYSSDEENLTYYNFVMPLRQNAVIEAEIAEVYEIKLADAVKDYITLDYSITPKVAAAGENVQFKVASYAGYWFKYVTAVEEDVILQEQGGIYSFTMPAHDVTISATTGAQLYSVYLKTEKEEVEDSKFYRFVGVEDGQTFEVGSSVKFTIETTNVDYIVNKVLADQTEISLEEEATEYSFVMPAYDVELSCLYDIAYRNVVAKTSTHYKAIVTTEVNGEEVPVDNNVIKGQRVYVDSEELPGEESNFVFDKFAYRGGDDAESAEDISIGLTYSGGRNYFEMPEDYKYIEVIPVEREVIFKYSPYVGTYNTSIHTWYGQDATGEIDIDGVLTLASSTYQLVKDEEDPSHFTVEGKDAAHVFIYDNDFVLAYTGTGKGDTYLLAKNRGARIWKNGFSYSVALLNGSNVEKQLLKLSLEGIAGDDADSTVEPSEVTVFVDYTENKAYWNVEIVKLAGAGYHKDDIFAVREAGVEDETYLTLMKITDEKGSTDGYQHFGTTEVDATAETKTYTGELGDLYFNKYGGIAVDGEVVDPELTENKIKFTKGGTTYELTLDEGAGTYEVTYNSDTDDFSAIMYSWKTESEPAAENNPVTLKIDDTGKAVLNVEGAEVENWSNVEFDFKVRNKNVYTFESQSNGELVVTLSDDGTTITFVYEQGGATGETIYNLPYGSVIGNTYKGSYSSYKFSVQFIDTNNLIFITQSGSSTEYRDAGTYTFDETTNALKVTIAEPIATFDLVIQSDGRLQFQNFKVSGYGSSFRGIGTSYFYNQYLSLVE